MNKYDLADPVVNEMWRKYYVSNGMPCVFVNSKSGTGLNNLYSSIENILKEKFERDKNRGLLRRPIKAMIVGIPNVGKSTLINQIVKKASTRTGDRPGVTKNKQWIKINSKMHLLDTPGILWPKFEDVQTGLNLAYTGAIKDEIMNVEELALNLIDFLKENYPDGITQRYNLADITKPNHAILEEMTINRNYFLQKETPDTLKMVKIFLDEYRGGKLGKISLERPY